MSEDLHHIKIAAQSYERAQVLMDLGRYAETVWHDTGAIDAPFFNRNTINTVLNEHRSGRKDHSHFFFYSMHWV